ncbi:CAAX prenyl protease 1 homolog [Chlamydiales bacterium SCGC AG-110-P3]|nr:CAAX prenyl protease 1 homolog [Chlamydiales bacterium SCGC AG-110-P3]
MDARFWILIAVASVYSLHLAADLLNRRRLVLPLPDAFRNLITEHDYDRQRAYCHDRITFGIALSLTTVIAVLGLAGCGVFAWLDSSIREWHFPEAATSLIFFGVLYVAHVVFTLPFSAYSTFVIEERYGFNRTTFKTFVLDIIKKLLLGSVIGSIILMTVLWFFNIAGNDAWLYCWGAIATLQVSLTYIAPIVIFPLFNTYSSLPSGELRNAIETYAGAQQFPYKDIYVCDASKRSSKGNAFFVGFGKLRRIALYDTLIKQLSVDEIVAIFAHEVGHYRRHHVPILTALSMTVLALQLWIFSSIVQMEYMTQAFGFSHHSLHATILVFGYLYIPLDTMLSVVGLWISRCFEFQADAFAANTSSATVLVSALKILGKQNYIHLSPHPLAVVMEHSHPPITQRIKALKSCSS